MSPTNVRIRFPARGQSAAMLRLRCVSFMLEVVVTRACQTRKHADVHRLDRIDDRHVPAKRTQVAAAEPAAAARARRAHRKSKNDAGRLSDDDQRACRWL